MSIVINSFFTNGGVPATGLAPTIRIWEVAAGSHSLVVGQPTQVNDPVMTEVGDGFYKFEFDTLTYGHDPLKAYVIRSDGGNTLPVNERYSVASTDESAVGTLSPTTIADIVDGVWDESAAAHVAGGSMGLLQNQTAADAAAVNISVTTAVSLIQTLLKYETNRTRIDKTLKTLTIYDNDGTTPLKVFDLRDSNGALSVVEVCERDPQ